MTVTQNKLRKRSKTNNRICLRRGSIIGIEAKIGDSGVIIQLNSTGHKIKNESNVIINKHTCIRSSTNIDTVQILDRMSGLTVVLK